MSNILVIKHGSLGDIAQASGVIQDIFENHKEDKIYLWMSLGLLLSIAFLSKYQAYLFGITLFIAFIIWRRNVLFTKNFYISLLIALLRKVFSH